MSLQSIYHDFIFKHIVLGKYQLLILWGIFYFFKMIQCHNPCVFSKPIWNLPMLVNVNLILFIASVGQFLSAVKKDLSLSFLLVLSLQLWLSQTMGKWKPHRCLFYNHRNISLQYFLRGRSAGSYCITYLILLSIAIFFHQLAVHPADHDGFSFLIFPSAFGSIHLTHFCNLVDSKWYLHC